MTILDLPSRANTYPGYCPAQMRFKRPPRLLRIITFIHSKFFRVNQFVCINLFASGLTLSVPEPSGFKSRGAVLLRCWNFPGSPVKLGTTGGVGERFNPAVLKTVGPERVPGVRIPPPPPLSRQVSFSVLENAENTVFPRKISDVAVRKGPHSLSYSRIEASESEVSLTPK